MKLLMNLLILFSMPILFSSVYGNKDNDHVDWQYNTQEDDANYCNSRFDFCVEYPSLLLPVQKTSANDDGIILNSGDENIQVIVNGSYNVTNWHPEELLLFTIEGIENEEKVANILFFQTENDSYESQFIVGNNSYYNRSFFIKDYYVSVLIKVPVDQPMLMEELKENVKVNYGENG